jgi:Family of unknown function (DUF6580)
MTAMTVMISNIRRRAAAIGMELPLAGSLLVLDIVARLLPHAPNFTPIAASALFAGVAFRSRLLAMTTPIAAMALGDLALGCYDWRIASVVYTSLALPAIAGMCGRHLRTQSLLFLLGPLALSSSVAFFVTTNFAVWAFSGMYADDLAGLLKCYVAALPFLRNGVMGDFFWTAVLFAGWCASTHAADVRYTLNRAWTTACARLF